MPPKRGRASSSKSKGSRSGFGSSSSANGAPHIIDVDEETWDIRGHAQNTFNPKEEYAGTRDKFSLAVHHGGLFVGNGYVGGVLNYVDNCTVRQPITSYLQVKYKLNNMCETFNSKIVLAREKPIITMLEELRTQQLERIQIRGQWVKNYDFPVPPVIKEIIDKVAAESTSWRSLWNGEHEYQVTGPYGQFVVNLRTKKCTCGLWQLRGIPCVHAATSILKNRDSITDYVSEYYSRIRMSALYEHVLYPINGMENWPRSSEFGFEMDPPNTKRQRGRPRKVRREQNQVQFRENGVEELMRTTLITCSRCGHTGHNKRTCQNDPRPPTSQRSGASSSQPQSGERASSSRSTAAPQAAPAGQAPAAERGQPARGTAGAAGPARPATHTRRAQRCGRRRNAD